VDEHGSHAGLSPEETQGFALLPPTLTLPDVEEFIRPSVLRAAALHLLRRQPLTPRPPRKRVEPKYLRVMTYNVHGCRGMDGRISPGRIARIIEQFHPDIIALQELDFGRARSQQHDQPNLIAAALGMQVQFCPTVIHDDEQYGHALLSHEPMEIIRTANFEADVHRRHAEPRGALWVRVQINGESIHLMNTHFGLRRKEQTAQTAELLGENWMGKIPEDAPMMLCGDFNAVPQSRSYGAITGRLRDVQNERDGFVPLNTFTTFHPFRRIDHIFISQHYEVEKVMVPRNDLTRVASDHLPLIVDLRRK
jgi:endonuclease/exonuclease/phosphatase family metal-dependent hydrolase